MRCGGTMNEILYEECAEPKNYKTQKTFYIIYTVLMWVMIAFSVLLLCIGFVNLLSMLPLLIISVGSAVLFAFVRTKIYYCVDCIFVSGSTRIIKVVNYKRRKKVIIYEAKEVEQMGKIGSETFEKWYNTPNVKKIYATPNKYIENGYYTVVSQSGNKYLVMLECKETYLQHLVSYTGKQVIERDYK